MQSLKTYNGPRCSFLIELVIVGMVLFQQQYQGLCPAMGFSFWLSSINFGADSLSNAEQLISPDHHFSYLKGFAVFYKSVFLLCSKALIVMSPNILVTVTDSFQLCLHPETAFAQSTGSPYPLPILLVSSSYGHSFVSEHELWRLCPGQSHPHSPLMTLSPRRPVAWYSSNSRPQSCLPYQRWP